MKRQRFKTWLSQWREDRFDWTSETMGELHPSAPQAQPEDDAWRDRPVRRLYEGELKFFRSTFSYMAAVLAFVMIFFLLRAVVEMPNFGSADSPASTSPVIKRYIEDGLKETGAVNIVAGVILDYRAFDTLGKSHVLFTASVAVFILLLQTVTEKEKERERRILQDDLILKKTAQVLIPLLVLFGIYVLLNGHLGPGGGFSGGAIIGSSFILYSLAYGPERLSSLINMKTYRAIVVSALFFYSLSKCYSFFCGANHYETIFGPGTPGAIFSAGLIMPLNVAVGMVVACTMYGFYTVFKQGRL